MRNSLKTLAVSSLVVLGLGGLALPSYAERGDCGPMGMGGDAQGKRGERMQEHHQQRQQKLHDALKLNADQDAGWKKYAESMQPPARGAMMRPDADQKMTAPQRAEKMLEVSKQFQERMTTHLAALKTFYATLTPEQQKTFDEFHTGPRGRHDGKRGPARMDKGESPSKN